MGKYISKYSAGLSLILLAFCSVSQAGEVGTLSVPPINPSPTSQQIPGKIIWHDLATTNIKATQQFYTDLLGWRFKVYGSGKDTYYLISHRGKPVGGLVPLTTKQAAENHNQWVSYISVPDVAQASQYVKTNGGMVLLDTTPFKHQGELAVFADPEGALFGVLNSSSGDPADGASQPGEWVWADLMVNNPKQAIKFYQGIATYAVKIDARHPKAKEYYLYKNKLPRAAIIPLPSGKYAPKVLPNWLPYIYVTNIAAAVVKTTKLGGSIILNPATQIYGGKLAIIADPGGAAVGLVELRKKQTRRQGAGQ